MAARFKNLTRQTFGWLTVVSHAGFNQRRRRDSDNRRKGLVPTCPVTAFIRT